MWNGSGAHTKLLDAKGKYLKFLELMLRNNDLVVVRSKDIDIYYFPVRNVLKKKLSDKIAVEVVGTLSKVDRAQNT
ncbi:CLUMA_CG021513, isoform A [Clunio marinus]|uniref:CLUMA_CG021513, isoform A n=1 Tax=Clunio marinus TaxID=568069 RepID=A0A1J1JC79_9DIPT|nr:CLUMA_CG021513, isoform A [Clunio marinus]